MKSVKIVAYSSAVDWRTCVKDAAYLAVCIQGFNEHFQFMQELLEMVSMNEDRS
jgi:mannitol/fructose-specific phosphotransferase system IIA component